MTTEVAPDFAIERIDRWFPNFSGPLIPWGSIDSPCYSTESIVQNGGLNDPLKKIITNNFMTVAVNFTVVQNPINTI